MVVVFSCKLLFEGDKEKVLFANDNVTSYSNFYSLKQGRIDNCVSQRNFLIKKEQDDIINYIFSVCWGSKIVPKPNGDKTKELWDELSSDVFRRYEVEIFVESNSVYYVSDYRLQKNGKGGGKSNDDPSFDFSGISKWFAVIWKGLTRFWGKNFSWLSFSGLVIGGFLIVFFFMKYYGYLKYNGGKFYRNSHKKNKFQKRD